MSLIIWPDWNLWLWKNPIVGMTRKMLGCNQHYMALKMSAKMHLHVFVQIENYTCWIWKRYLSELQIVFVRLEKCRAACGQPTLSSLENVSKSALTSCRPDSPHRLLEEFEDESDWWNMSRLRLRLVAGWKPAARLDPPSLSSPITLPAPPPLRLLWPYWPQLQAVDSSPFPSSSSFSSSFS